MTIGRICRQVFKSKGEKVPDPRTIAIDKVSSDEIFKLRNQGLSYSKIVKNLKEKGINVSLSTVRNICKKAYAEKGKTDNWARKEKTTEISDDEIYNLRQKGFTYEEIAEKFSLEGKKISVTTVRSRCKKIYALKKEIEPVVKRGRKKEYLAELENKIQTLTLKKQRAEDLLENYEYIGLAIDSKGIELSK